MGEQEGLTRRQLLRAGTLAGATVAWIAPSATVHAMTSSQAEGTSGEPQPPPEDSRSEEPSENQPETQTGDTPRSDDGTSVAGDLPQGDDSPIEVSDSEVENPTEAGLTDEPVAPRPPEVVVEDNEITAEAPRPPGDPSVSPPPVVAAQQSELPQTGIDADVLTGIGAGLTALGAAALRASREPETD